MHGESPWEPDSTEEVIRRYSSMVYRLAFARLGNRYDADEVFQEVFLRYVKKASGFAREEHIKAWLIRVTINCSKKLKNSPWRLKTQPLQEDLAFEEKQNADLYRELQRLPEKYREVIHLFYYESMSLEEMSRVLNRKNGTLRTQLTRARAMLREFMREEDYV